MLNPRQLEAFRAVIVTGGVTSAADFLNVSQPAVTRLIRDLQETLKLKLFVKRGARLLPTSEGIALYREVERQFIGLERIRTIARQLREGRSGSLRVATLPALSLGFLPRVVAEFLRATPNLDIAIFGGTSTQVADWVSTGFCELGFAQMPLDFPSLEIEPLPAVEAVAIVPQGHRLSDRAELGPRDFVDLSFISLENSSLLRYQIDSVFSMHNVTRRMHVETPLSMIACALVSSGAGVSIVDPFTAEEYRSKGVSPVPFRPIIKSEIAAAWARARPRSDLAKEFIAAMADRIGSHYGKADSSRA